jgi:hypothetical protein
VEPSSVHSEASEVLALLSRALAAFGGDQAPVAPPEFATGRHLEDDVGCGHF